MNRILRPSIPPIRWLLVGALLLLGFLVTTPVHASDLGVTFGVVGADGQLYGNPFSEGYIPLSGNPIAAPALVYGKKSDGSGAVFYIATGPDHRLYYRTATDPWQVLTPSGTACLDNPAAVSNSTDSGATYNLWVACTGMDHQVYVTRTQFPLTSSSLITSWNPLGGATNYGPALALDSRDVYGSGLRPFDPTPLVFAVGMDHGLFGYKNVRTGWMRVGGWCTGHPAAALVRSTTYLACQGADRALWYTQLSASADFWTPFQSLGGALIGGPAIGTQRVGDLGFYPVFVAEGADTAVWENDGRGPTYWQSMGGAAALSGTGAYAAPQYAPF